MAATLCLVSKMYGVKDAADAYLSRADIPRSEMADSANWDKVDWIGGQNNHLLSGAGLKN